MEKRNSLFYEIALTQLPNIGVVTAKKMIAYCGGAEQVFKESKSALAKVPGVGAVRAKVLDDKTVLQTAEKELKFIEKNNIQAFSFLSEDYPNKLKHCEDAPIVLYGKGKLNFNKTRNVSVVGTRKPTVYGQLNCEALVKDLKPYDVTIYSGLAYGVDIMAHRAAYKNNISTVAALAHGLDIIYPSMHRKDVDAMLENGGVITEFISGTKPDRENFPKRNRIVAGISDCTVVVESAVKGGSLITAELANGYNRDVFAFPGNIGLPFSAGCNKLIKINKAHLLESVKDIEYIMNWSLVDAKQQAIQPKLFVDLSEEQQILVDLLSKKSPLSIDQLMGELSFPASKLSSLLLELEFEGVVSSLPGKMYTLN